MITIRVALLALVFLSGHGTPLAYAETLEGIPTIVDADTLKLSGETIRFKHIDAPETKQVCQDGDGYDYQCGEVATEALKNKIGAERVRCEIEGRGFYGRPLGECYLGEEALGRWLVLNGYALAFRKYSTLYVPEEEEAMKAKRRLWSGTFEKPWEWRQRQRNKDSTTQ